MNKIIVKKLNESKKDLDKYADNSGRRPSQANLSNSQNNLNSKNRIPKSERNLLTPESILPFDEKNGLPVRKYSVSIQSINLFNNSRNQHGDSSASGSSFKVTKMLVCVSTVFLLLNAPYHFFRIYTYTLMRITKRKHQHQSEQCILKILQFIYYASFSVNFFLYSISGAAFRNEIKAFLINIFKRNK
jgi:hypothetical protein